MMLAQMRQMQFSQKPSATSAAFVLPSIVSVNLDMDSSSCNTRSTSFWIEATNGVNISFSCARFSATPP